MIYIHANKLYFNGVKYIHAIILLIKNKCRKRVWTTLFVSRDMWIKNYA